MSESSITITDEYLESQGLSKNLPQRFWRKVNKTDSCWLWIASQDGCGYGTIRTASHGRITRAHRVSWILHRGPIPSGLNVLHNCPSGDNPSCVNPDHLWLGTQGENCKDRDDKGRCWHPKGEEVKHSKLNDEKVRMIRQMSGHMTKAEIARQFSVSAPAIGKVLKGRSWKHV